jgi:SAM-dependent methyltransferase
VDLKQSNIAVITIYLLKPFIGKGRGPEAISQAMQMAFDQWSELSFIYAFIRPDNIRSIQAFQKCGYTKSVGNDTTEIKLVYEHHVLEDSDYRDTLRKAYFPLMGDGDNFASVGWGSRKTQFIRFKALSNVADISDMKIMDVGCGLGHFVDYIDEAGISVDYQGIDYLDEMVKRALVRHPSRNFKVSNILREKPNRDYDYIFASGLFTYANMEMLQSTVSAMFRGYRRGISFNSLSSWAICKDSNEYYANPLKVVEFCKTLSSNLTLVHNYLPNDFTVYLYREEEG